MSVVKVANNPIKSGTCPHGLPQGACPICNGMGGGGKISESSSTQKRNPNEWSYAKCMAVWQEMLAKENKQMEAKMLLIRQFNLSEEISRKLSNSISNVQVVLKDIQTALPPKLQVVFEKAVSSILNPIFKMLSKIPQVVRNIENFIKDIKAQILDVTAKLTAVIGEIKNFIQKKLYEKFKKVSKKLLLLFMAESEGEEAEENYEIKTFKSKELKKIRKTKLRKETKEEKYESAID